MSKEQFEVCPSIFVFYLKYLINNTFEFFIFLTPKENKENLPISQRIANRITHSETN